MVLIYVTDAFSKGDYFEVYEVDGVAPTTSSLIGMTPMVPVASGSVTDPDVAFNEPTYSHDVFEGILSAGTHYFAFREVGHNYGSGAFFVKFCPGSVGGEVTPYPVTPVMLIAALVGTFSLAIAVPTLSKRLR